ncbi:MAG: response regulator transcription factor [Ignavibacteriales bacterium]|nr:response regulator transcription factor [Ignavibacteriales bacterium]
MITENANINRKKLLIVDDSVEIREGLKRFVAGLNSIELVGEAGDGISALEMVDRLKPDFVTLDIKMPGMSGLLILHKIKKKYPLITVVMLTNFPFEHYRQVCLNAGASYFFDKSNEFEQMIDTLKSLTADSISINNTI